MTKPDLLPCPHCKGTGTIDTEGMTLGQYLKTIREQRGMTLRDVEAGTTLSNAAVSQIETGKIKDPGFSTLKQLMKLYELNWADLPGEDNDKRA